MSAEKISSDTILILELEGLAPALNEVGALLSGHGLDKHGHRRWKKLSRKKLRKKGIRHLRRPGVDEESGRLHATHGAARSLMHLTKRLKE